MLEVINISKSYGTLKALDNVSFTLSPGVYGLLGPNGAGKSTLISIICDNLNPDSGEIRYNGENAVTMGKRFRRLLGYMPQQQTLYDTFTLNRFLYFIAALKDMQKKEAGQQIDNLIEIVNLKEFRHKPLSGFSGGMKQRALIAQALLGNPEIIILDEPTAGLDPKERISIRNLISKISVNKIVIMATHVVSDIEYIANEVLILKKGILLKKDNISKLTDEIKGKVFEYKVYNDEIQLDKLAQAFVIGNIVNHNGLLTTRLINNSSVDIDEGIYHEIKEISPSLEDVYMYLFGEQVI